MNEFTKIELQDIMACVHSFKIASIRGGFHYYDDLNDKIQSMIDNYFKCQHKNIVTGAYPRSNPPKKCDNCGVLYYE